MVSSLTSTFTHTASRLWERNFAPLLSLLLLQIPDFGELYSEKKGSVFNVLWALVFGFATLNILSLGARRFEREKGGLNFGEILAILVVVVSIFLLAWEMLYVFHILPFKLTPR